MKTLILTAALILAMPAMGFAGEQVGTKTRLGSFSASTCSGLYVEILNPSAVDFTVLKRHDRDTGHTHHIREGDTVVAGSAIAGKTELTWRAGQKGGSSFLLGTGTDKLEPGETIRFAYKLKEVAKHNRFICELDSLEATTDSENFTPSAEILDGKIVFTIG